MVSKQTATPSPVSTYRTRSSFGITPKKRQSYGDFIEPPLIKKKSTNLIVSTQQGKCKKEISIKVVEDELGSKKENVEVSSSHLVTIKECCVRLERMSEKLNVESSQKSFPAVPRMTLTTHVDVSRTNYHKSYKKCAVEGCVNSKGGGLGGALGGTQFFGIPEVMKQKKQWMKLLKKKWSPGMGVCSEHFDQTDFTDGPDGPGRTLKEGVVPKKWKSQWRPRKVTCETIEKLIENLHNKKLLNDEQCTTLKPFKDLTQEEIECGEESGEKYKKVCEFIKTLHSLSEDAYHFVHQFISLPDISTLSSTTNIRDYKSILMDLFPQIKEITTNTSTSVDLIDVFIDAKLILKGVKYLVENTGNFPLSCLRSYKNDESTKEKVHLFSKIVFLNSPQTFHQIKGPLHLPDVSLLFPSLASTDESSIISLTLGQLMNEASRTCSIPEESVCSLIPFAGSQICPFSTTTVSMHSHVISAIFFNARVLFNFLTQYLPLPNIVLFPKTAVNKENDDEGEVDKEGFQINESTSSPRKISPKKQNSGTNTSNNRQYETTASDSVVPASSKFKKVEDERTQDEFIKAVCPKTGKNVAKLDVDTVGFLPRDLTVKVVGHVLTICGCREETGQKIEFLKTITLPTYVDADQAGCYYFKGKMSIHAPVLEGAMETDDKLPSNTNATLDPLSSPPGTTAGEDKVVDSSVSISESVPSRADIDSIMSNGDTPTGKKKNQKTHQSLSPNSSTASSDDDIPRNVAVLINVDEQEYVSLIVEVSRLFKPSEIVVKVRENKMISVTGETKSSDPQTKSRFYAKIEREFDLPKKIERTTLKAGCTGDGLLKIFAKVASDHNGQ